MHATSAVAIAVVALNAASALAVPVGPIGEGLVYKRTPTKTTVANTKDTAVSDPTKAGSLAKGAANASATTITVTVRPRPTACKAGETPSVNHKGSKSSHKGPHEKQSAEGHAAHVGGNHASPAPAVVARSAGAAATPTGTGKDAPSGAAPTPAPQPHKNADHHKGAAGAVFSSNTHVGKDHMTTVRHFVKATTTRCFEPTAGAGGHSKKSSHKGGRKGEKLIDSSDATSSTKGKKSEAKVVRRGTDSHVATPTPTSKGTAAPEKGAANASATTLTVTVRPRPTACKAGETPSVNHKGSKSTHKGSHKKQSAEGHAAHAGNNHTSPAPAVVARSAGAAATPTGTSKEAASGAAPTPAPQQHKNAEHHKGVAGAVFSTNTHVGKDHVTTVRHFVKATTTRCFEPTASAGGYPKSSSHKGGRKAGKPADSTTHKSGAGSQAASSKMDTKPDAKLVARAADILERFFGELDELD